MTCKISTKVLQNTDRFLKSVEKKATLQHGSDHQHCARATGAVEQKAEHGRAALSEL